MMQVEWMATRRACLELTHNWCAPTALLSALTLPPWLSMGAMLRRGTENDDSYKVCTLRT